jgi:hypothetical protein
MRSSKYERPMLYLHPPAEIRTNRPEGYYEVENQEESQRCIIIDLNVNEENKFIVSPFFLELNINDAAD